MSGTKMASMPGYNPVQSLPGNPGWVGARPIAVHGTPTAAIAPKHVIMPPAGSKLGTMPMAMPRTTSQTATSAAAKTAAPTKVTTQAQTHTAPTAACTTLHSC